MGKDVLIIGGGIVGLCSAYFLQKEGHKVTVLDKSDITSGASFVNAGYITPSHIIPLASPGMISKGIKWMFNSSSPFYMQPRWDTDFFKWSWYFHKSSTKEKVDLAIPLIKDINIISRDLFTSIKNSGDLGDFQLERKGLLMLYKTDKEGEHEMQVAKKASYLGLEVSSLNKKELDTLQPNVTMNVKGAIHYECDGHTTPTEFMKKMLEYLKRSGVIIKTNEEVIDLSTENGRIIKVTTNKNYYSPGEVVLAAGSWSDNLSKKLNIKLPIQAGKGYRINVPRPTGITIPAILMEAKVAVTPMTEYTRFAGTMEFSGINDVIRKQRVEAIANATTEFYPEIKISEAEKLDAKSGLRPVSPDGLPYIGKSSSLKNLTVATGHAMMGWSLGPVTGKLVSEIISDKKTSMDINSFSPNRRF
ncbi:NAD(P)/FAD-dependent oxidoreductase [Arenibacter algicola]|jgi:D-amino-acid dehydrogenase|uniref:D-amino acid dehydrogenase n=1 Tax=Arenibacter algicola TaxID=616991 RepID=A0A221V1X1_9FLAO|nr:FAD-dependent oxidoreductase [Arenibacter algicola]ASO07594.1 D-amino acid dehydrogenase [Arenibacter algicola]|tara:strand:- start:17984 stop:19234 length:1251 start_codon:yes stop_codon:yes gene_type:complete